MENQTLTIGQKNTLIDRIKTAYIDKKTNLESDHNIKETLVYIYALIGIKEMPSRSEDIVIINYIKNCLKNFTLKEFRVAFELAAQQKLGIKYRELNTYQNFNTIYLSNIMNAYRNYRFKHIQNEPEIEPILDKALIRKRFIDTICREFQIYKETGKQYQDGGSRRYYFLVEIGLINYTTDQKNKYIKLAEPIFNNLDKRKLDSIVKTVKSIARQLALYAYYQKLINTNENIKDKLI